MRDFDSSERTASIVRSIDAAVRAQNWSVAQDRIEMLANHSENVIKEMQAIITNEAEILQLSNKDRARLVREVFDAGLRSASDRIATHTRYVDQEIFKSAGIAIAVTKASFDSVRAQGGTAAIIKPMVDVDWEGKPKEVDLQLASRKADGAYANIMRNQGRDTTIEAGTEAGRDGHVVFARRISVSDACDFCNLLTGADMQFVYNYEKLKHFHDHCRCRVTIVTLEA